MAKPAQPAYRLAKAQPHQDLTHIAYLRSMHLNLTPRITKVYPIPKMTEVYLNPKISQVDLILGIALGRWMQTTPTTSYPKMTKIQVLALKTLRLYLKLLPQQGTRYPKTSSMTKVCLPSKLTKIHPNPRISQMGPVLVIVWGRWIWAITTSSYPKMARTQVLALRTPPSVSQTAAPAGNQEAPDSKDDQRVSDSPASQSSSEFQDISSESTTGDIEEPMDTDDRDLILPQNDKETISSSESSPSVPQTVTLAGNQVDPNRNKNDDDETPSEREIVLKKIYDQLRNWFGTQSESAFNFETSKNCPGAIEISFKHNNKYWLIRFPAEFPTIPAKLFHSTREASLRSRECSQSNIVESLINDVNILLTMKNICGECSICKNFTKEMLSQPDYSSRFTEFGVAINKIVTELTSTFADVTELHMNHPVDTSHGTITFNHGTKWWIINVPVQFPDLPAKVYNQSHKESFQRRDVMFYENKSSSPRDLNTSKLMIKAINCNCSCSTCKNMHEQYH